MDLSVGPIESYIPGSSWFDLTQYSDLGVQEQVSVNLTASNLWLVDKSQLNFQDSAQPPIVLPGEGQLYESPVQISAIASPDLTLSQVGGSYTPESSITTTTLPVETGGNVTFSGINGEIDSDGSTLTTSSGQSTITVIQMISPSNPISSTSSGSPLFSTAYPNSDPPQTTTTSETPETLFPPTSTLISPPSLTPGTTPGTTPGITPGTPISTTEVVPVPFDINTTLGLLIFSFLLSKKLYRQYTSTQTQRKRDRNTLNATLEIIPE
ncbi:MAG: hypothetical protein SFY66_20230 [Oculatellaceae cyanobacterium bins.114]|nr:hypothetical protein [Oculatellaceae cyanobacterium bins.114]